tara:strand:+ start:1607 stop:2626 length:1020 start_codon:yes stop_codon:yes gene_type:complete
MVFAAFQDEMSKIAAVKSRGGLDLSGIHKDNLREQRDDLLKAERKGAYGKAALTGAGAGIAMPTILSILPSLMIGGDSVSRIGERMALEEGLFKVLKNNPDFGMTGRKDHEIRAAAEILAEQQSSLPTAMKMPREGKLFQRIRQSYSGEANTGWKIPNSMIQDGQEDAARSIDPSWKPGKDLIVDDGKGLEAFRERFNSASRIRREDRIGPERLRHMPDNPSFEQLRNVGASEEAARLMRHISKREMIDSAIPVGRPVGSHPAAGSAGLPEVGSLLDEISKRHGKVETPSQARSFMRHADSVFRKAKPALAMGALLGTAAGLASIRAKRKKGREIRSGR